MTTTADTARAAAEAKLSKAQVRVLQLLSDGLPHHGIKEIKPLLPDGTMNGGAAVCAMIRRIKDKLLPQGYTVVCELYNGRICYRYVKLVTAGG